MNIYLTAITMGLVSINLACGQAETASQAGVTGTNQTPAPTETPPQARPDSVTTNAVQQSDPFASYGSMLVENVSSLPTCDASKQGALAYTKTEKKFYACAGQWEEISIKGDKGDAGDDGKQGLGISKMQLMVGISQDFCTEYTVDWCQFSGGQVVRFADGSIFVTATWYYSSLTIIDFDSNSDKSNISFIIPADTPAMWATLHDRVSRGNGFKNVYLFYDRDTDKFSLYHDTNDSGDVDSDDLLLANISLKDF